MLKTTLFGLILFLPSLALGQGVGSSNPDTDLLIAERGLIENQDIEIGPLPRTIGLAPEGRRPRDRRVSQGYWFAKAQAAGQEAYNAQYKQWVGNYSLPAKVIAVAKQPQLCSKLPRTVVDGCKKGVRAQVAYCKQALRDTIAKCKQDVRDGIARCKKRKPFYQAWTCEVDRLKMLTKCETQRYDIPFCEFDRINSVCCEGTRPQLAGMCAAGMSRDQLQKQSDKVQAICKIGSAIAKSAVKSYISGAALGVLNEVKSVKEIGETVAYAQKFGEKVNEYKKWSEGMIAAAEGRMADAQKALISLAPEINANINDAIKWKAAAEAAMKGQIDRFMTNAVTLVGDLNAVQEAVDTIEKLQGVADDLRAIKEAAEECVSVPYGISPKTYPGWKDVYSQESLEAAVAKYKTVYKEALQKAAKCRSVTIRVRRLGV
ncbi:uncharacterized protein B0I36DRAFT_358658 [Microdochium trichocladiopsis]|uniref:Uncharacterized protein n=1 Tax=Microdochium trichocladiopsis TaxID=1682393 RepID=A0A9P8YKD0_9PEZI|nr:uncharacterized protein B0I36DRAFT_358658 [Microdochium trichocladiopsis]KAH7041493.1 hypothetical protein B0I36DRAFT_358658 [Microdochium trichocladiopsis]